MTEAFSADPNRLPVVPKELPITVTTTLKNIVEKIKTLNHTDLEARAAIVAELAELPQLISQLGSPNLDRPSALAKVEKFSADVTALFRVWDSESARSVSTPVEALQQAGQTDWEPPAQSDADRVVNGLMTAENVVRLFQIAIVGVSPTGTEMNDMRERGVVPDSLSDNPKVRRALWENRDKLSH